MNKFEMEEKIKKRVRERELRKSKKKNCHQHYCDAIEKKIYINFLILKSHFKFFRVSLVFFVVITFITRLILVLL